MTLYLTLALIFLWIGVFMGGWLGWQLLRQNGRLLLRVDELEKRLDELEFGEGGEPEGLPVGSEAPAFELPDLAGGRQSLAQFRGQPMLMVFFNPDCGFCRELVPKLAALPPHPVPLPVGRGEGGLSPGEGRPLPLIITSGDAEKNRQFFAEHKVGCPVLLQNDGEVAKAYQVNGTPAGYLVSAEGKIASGLVIGAEALLKLASEPAPEPSLASLDGESEKTSNGSDGLANRFSQRSVARSKIKRDGLKAGTPAPDFRLPRLDGRGDLTLSDLRGKRVLLVFSSPGCGPCNALAPELEKFHRSQNEAIRNGQAWRSPSKPLTPFDGERVADQPGEGKAVVVMISKGEPKENRAKVKEHGLTFPVVLQQQWEISRRYALFATPIAYLIDENGVISRDVAVGVDQIQALLLEAANGCIQNREASFVLNSAGKT